MKLRYLQFKKEVPKEGSVEALRIILRQLKHFWQFEEFYYEEEIGECMRFLMQQEVLGKGT